MIEKTVIYHVGGSGEYGPITAILNQIRPHVHLVVFEIRGDTDDARRTEQMTRDGMTTTLIRIGVDERTGTAPFHINKFPKSSSLLPCARTAWEEHAEFPWCHTWGQNAELAELIEVETMSIDDIVQSGMAPPPHVISIDAQGAELRILKGATKALADALCVVSEVEYFEIYEGQGLFDDQMALLSRRGFRLLDIMGPQWFHAGPSVGRGFLTAGETIFLRYAMENAPAEGQRSFCAMRDLGDSALMRLAGIAASSHAISYVYTLMREIRRRNPALIEAMRRDAHYSVLVQVLETIELNLPQYRADPRYFMKMLKF